MIHWFFDGLLFQQVLGRGFANNRPERAQDKHFFSLPCISNKWNVPVDMFFFSSRTCIYIFLRGLSCYCCWCFRNPAPLLRYGKMFFHVFFYHPVIYLSKVNFPPAGCPLTEDMKEKVHLVFASLFTDRAISYRHDRGENSPKRPKGKLHCWVPTSQSY